MTAAFVNPRRAGNALRQYKRFKKWCASFNQCLTLADLNDPYVFLACYAYRYRCGKLAPSGRAVRAQIAEDAIRLVGQMIALVGHNDPRLDKKTGTIDKRFTWLWKDWNHYNSPPRWVKPVPLPVLLEAQRLADASGSVTLVGTARLMWVAFYFLCWPGEYVATTKSNHFFWLCNLCLYLANKVLDLACISNERLCAASCAMLEFTDQKNGVQGGKSRSAPAATLWPLSPRGSRIR